VKGLLHNPQFRDTDIRSDQVDLIKNKPDHKAIKEIEQHYLDPLSAPKKVLEKFISNNQPSLNSEWKGIIAGAIYLVSHILDNKISQVKIADHIKIDKQTLRKRYREIAKSLKKKIQ